MPRDVLSTNHTATLGQSISFDLEKLVHGGRNRNRYSLQRWRQVISRYLRRNGVTLWDLDFDSSNHEFILTTPDVKDYRIAADSWIYVESTW